MPTPEKNGPPSAIKQDKVILRGDSDDDIVDNGSDDYEEEGEAYYKNHRGVFAGFITTQLTAGDLGTLQGPDHRGPGRLPRSKVLLKEGYIFNSQVRQTP